MGTAYDDKNFSSVLAKECVIATKRLNVRTGPGVEYPVVTSLAEDTKLSVIGAINNWFVVILPDQSVGMVSKNFVNITKFKEVSQGADDEIIRQESDELEEEIIYAEESPAERLFLLVNEARMKNHLTAYSWDNQLNEAARIKVEDMAENHYFGHESPNLGTPFLMLRDIGIFYKTASENIANSESIESAHEKMLNSLAHKSNLLSKRYNKMGIAVLENPDADGKFLIVQIFIEA
jgi:uncharacterized protein YkwD